MRSTLTMLGIIIGVSAVIAMIAVGSGAKAQDCRADCQHGVKSSDRPVRKFNEWRTSNGVRDGSDFNG